MRDSAARAIRALEASGIDDADLWTGALGLGAWAEAVAGDVGLAERLLDELGARTAGAARDDLISWETGFARGIAAIRRGAFEDGSSALVAAARAAQRAGRPDLAQASWETAATVAVCAGDGELAVERLEHALAAARGRGVERIEVRIHGDIARILAGLGRHDAAAARLATAAQVACDLDGSVHAELDRDRALVALAAGRLDEAERLLASALDGALVRGRPGARLAHVEALVGLGRTEEARRALRMAMTEPIEPDDLPATLVPRLAAQQAAIAAAEGDHEEARRRLEEAEKRLDAPDRRLARRPRGGRHRGRLGNRGRRPRPRARPGARPPRTGAGMPVIEAEALVAAPAEEVFKILHDPTRHPEWWVGVDAVEGVRRQDDALRFSVDSSDHPGTRLEQRQEPLAGGGIVMTCLQLRHPLQMAADPRGRRDARARARGDSRAFARARRRLPREDPGVAGAADDALHAVCLTLRHGGRRRRAVGEP